MQIEEGKQALSLSRQGYKVTKLLEVAKNCLSRVLLCYLFKEGGKNEHVEDFPGAFYFFRAQNL